MNKTFDLHRLGMVIRWDVLNNWTHNLGAIVGLAICFSFFNIIRLYNISEFVSTSDNLEVLSKSYQQSACMFFVFISFMVIYVLASCIFRNMKTKLQRESFLMLPATNLEKYVARLLFMTIGGVIALLGALVVSDIIQIIFSFIITPGFHTSITWPVLSHFMSAIHIFPSTDLLLSGNDWLKCIALSAFLLFVHSFFTLGGSFYRKLPALLTPCTGLVLCFIFVYILNELAEWAPIHINGIDFSNGSTADYCITTTAAVVFLALAAFNYWASYKIFTRMQVICNKWLNI